MNFADVWERQRVRESSLQIWHNVYIHFGFDCTPFHFTLFPFAMRLINLMATCPSNFTTHAFAADQGLRKGTKEANFQHKNWFHIWFEFFCFAHTLERERKKTQETEN